MIIEARQGDITTIPVDVIVNAANSGLRGGSGVDGAIHRAAGPGLMRETSGLDALDVGDAVSTGAHDLPARWVVHTVGPIWSGGDQGEADDLASCYRRSIQEADRLGATSISFPAISTGVYRYPRRAAAGMAVRTLRELRPASIQRCLLVAFDAETLGYYEELLAPGR